jgi:hypothetical protein
VIDDQEVQERLKTERLMRSVVAREERRERIRIAGYDPDAYPKDEFDCDHNWVGPTGVCVACGSQRR